MCIIQLDFCGRTQREKGCWVSTDKKPSTGAGSKSMKKSQGSNKRSTHCTTSMYRTYGKNKYSNTF